MATNNFYNHENGIFVLPKADFEYSKGFLQELHDDCGELYADGITDEDVFDQMMFEDEQMADEFLEHHLGYQLEQKGYRVSMDGRHEATVYSKQGKLVAKLKLEAGYYEGAQCIVITDPEKLGVADYYNTQAEMLTEYTPNHKRLLKVVAENTRQLMKVGQFSNGGAVYEEA